MPSEFIEIPGSGMVKIGTGTPPAPASVPPPVRSRKILTASASKLEPRSDESRRRRSQHWQKTALEHVRNVPELNYASRFYSKMVKPLRIYPAFRDQLDRLTPITDGLPVEILDRIQDPSGGRSGILGQYGRLMFITAEALLLGLNLETDDERWSVVWTEEVEMLENGGLRHKPNENSPGKEYGPSEAVAYRLWMPSPERSGEPESTMRAVADIAEELLILTKAVRATAVSRIINGMIKVPSELSFGSEEAGVEDDPEANPFLADLIDHIMGAIENAGSPEAAAPFIAEGAEEYLAALDWIRLHDPATDYMEQNLRKEAVERLAHSLDFPAEYLLSLGDVNHWCKTSDCEILTRDRGFVIHNDLKIGDIVRTLNMNTGLAEWSPVLDIYRAEVVNEPMVEIRNARHHSVSTPAHRWPILKQQRRGWERRWATTATLSGSDCFIKAAPSADLPTAKTYDDSFVEIVAWFLTEGTCTWPSKSHCQVRIGQSHKRNPDRVKRIRDVLTGAYGPARETLRAPQGSGTRGALAEPAWREVAEERGMTLFHLNKAAYGPLLNTMESWQSKMLRPEFILSLTLEQLELFLEVCALGDGSVRNGGFAVEQKDPQRLAVVELAGILAGRAVVNSVSESGGFARFPLTTVRIHSPRSVRTSPVADLRREVSYTGTIWCPVTKNGTWLARHKGTVFYTGNSARAVTHEMWRIHGAPVAEQFCDDIGESYLRPALREANFEDWRRVVVAYDAANVIVPVDRSDDADRAFDRGALNEEGYRVMKGIDESLQPSEEEKRIWLAVKMRNPAFLKGTRFEIENEETGDFPPGPEASTDEPRDTEEGPPEPGPAGVSRRESRAAALHGAAYSALHRCREVAGARIRTGIRDRSRNATELVKLDGHKNAQAAAVLGKDVLETCGFADPLDLVKGGSDGFLSICTEWEIDDTQAKALAQTIQVFAAKTLFEHGLPVFPSGFFAQVARASEISNELGEEGTVRRNNKALEQLEHDHPADMASMAKG